MGTGHLSTAELSKHWDIPEKTLERWRCEGIGPRFMKVGQHVRYRREDIQQYEAASVRSSTVGRGEVSA